MTVEEIRMKYPYLYETHCHTSHSSACSKCSGEELARAAKAAGYTGIIVTDHNWGGNTAVSRNLPWENWVEEFAKGYEEAFRTGKEIGLDVFFGYEAGYHGTEFLIYGVNPEWLKSHPQIKTASIEEQYALIKEADGLVIHAHPFREEWYIDEVRLFPEWVDGVEGINATHSNSKSASHNNPAFDRKAVAYARQHGLLMSAGSDQHSTAMFGGGVAFQRKLTDIKDFIKAIRTQEDYVLTNGQMWYDSCGNLLNASQERK